MRNHLLLVDNAVTPKAWLELATGRKTVSRGACFIGRSATNTIVLPEKKVSRQHAMVEMDGKGNYWVIDLGSANGTYLNGRRITRSQLSHLDKIKIGSFELSFHNPPSDFDDAALALTDKTTRETRTLNCWLLVGDIEGATAWAKTLPEQEASKVIGHWLLKCQKIVEENGGTLNKFLGDGFLAYWPEHAKAAASVGRVLSALLELQQTPPPIFRVVAHYGVVMMGGMASLGEESLTGSEVNFVFRMEKLAGAIRVPRLLSQAAQAQLRTKVQVNHVGRYRLPSFEEEFDFYTFYP